MNTLCFHTRAFVLDSFDCDAVLYVVGSSFDGWLCARVCVRCVCIPGWVGPDCGLDYDECADHRCQNAAQCVDHLDGYTCTCPHGYTYVPNDMDKVEGGRGGGGGSVLRKKSFQKKYRSSNTFYERKKVQIKIQCQLMKISW